MYTVSSIHVNATKKIKSMALKNIAIKRTRLAEEVYQQLLDAIVNGDISPSDRLVQEKLAIQMGISRTPIREALFRLEQEGVIVTSQRGGFELYRMSEYEIKQLYQARAAIESQAARILASRNNKKHHKELRELIKNAENIKKPTIKNYFEANRTIHRKFVELVNNPYLLEMFDSIWNRAISFSLFASIEKIDLDKSLGNHTALVDAIETGNKTHALEAFIDHIQDGFDLQISAMDDYEPK